MGIRNLNRYLRNNCPESIKCIPISDISHKKIAVDISIYLYKYESENALLENMFIMLSIFRHYNIAYICIFRVHFYYTLYSHLPFRPKPE